MAYKQKNKWIASITLGGKKYRKSFSQKKYAEMWEQQKRREHELGILDLQRSSNVEIRKLCKLYLSETSLRVRASTMRIIKSDINTILGYCEAKSIYFADEFGKEFWLGLVSYAKAQGRKESTINKYLSTLKRVVDCAMENELMHHDPFEKCKMLIVDRPGAPKFFTVDEVKAIEENIKGHKTHGRFYPLFYIFVRTGLRSAELAGLEKKDVDFENKKIILPPEKNKSRKPRFIPLSGEMCEFLQEHISRKPDINYVFSTTLGTKFSGKHMNRSFRQAMDYCEEIGVVSNTKEQNVHSLRRTYISNLVMAGVDPQKIMRVVGHKDWSTMRKYLHLAPNYGNDIVEKLPY